MPPEKVYGYGKNTFDAPPPPATRDGNTATRLVYDTFWAREFHFWINSPSNSKRDSAVFGYGFKWQTATVVYDD